MLICAIDTSGREGSLALAEAEEREVEVLHLAAIAGGTYSAQLIPTLSAGLAKVRRQKSEIGLFVVASGPGSFTGLRVGLSTVKALAEVTGAKVVALSVLEAIALAAQRAGRVIAVLDAQRKEVFVGEFVRNAGPSTSSAEALSAQDDVGPASAKDAQMWGTNVREGGPVRTSSHESEPIPAKDAQISGTETRANGGRAISAVRESLVGIDEFVAWLKTQVPTPAVVTPDAAIEARVREGGLAVEAMARPAAGLYARFGWEKYLASDVSDLETLDANYIRRSDAEIFSAPKLGIPESKR